MVAVGGARGLQDILPGISGLFDQPDRLRKIRRAGAERHRGAAAQAILDMHIENARRVGGDFLAAIKPERGAVADVVIDAEDLARKFGDELSRAPPAADRIRTRS